MKTLPLKTKSFDRSPVRFCLLLTGLVCFALSPGARAADGGLSNNNTAEGTGALNSLATGGNNTALGSNALFSNATASDNTATGAFALQNNTASDNTATGYEALFKNTTGDANTATGVQALDLNSTGRGNTATGFQALSRNTTADDNTAMGLEALEFNTTGSDNTATGAGALTFNDTGVNNTATGASALLNNINGSNNTSTGAGALFTNGTGSFNTATGVNVLVNNSTGNGNTATGANALQKNDAGNDNTATGLDALFRNTGSSNIALGFRAGLNLTTGSNNIDIGNAGVAGEAAMIRIGTVGTQNGTYIAGISGATVPSGVAVIIDTNGHLGTTKSSGRFKEAIKPMDKASEAILALKPVTFRYKHELDPDGIAQFGLVAEEVEKVNPDLVARDTDGKVYTVRYDAVNAMLLNEFLKEHKTVQELKSAAAKQKATIVKQQKQIETLTEGLQKVSDKLELTKTRPQFATNNR